MDSGNGNNQQQQRYCPTPIMAPPSVATSPPVMGGANVMGSMHQPTHHPPPSISPHPAAYYSHQSAGTSHYPTPNPTPPPPSMHHPQYYGHQQHPYYAHGSHQQAQQQTQSQQSHHGMAAAHVPAAPQGQHPHLMSHGSYHHPTQSQLHHQQWATHQQQPHHYYHQQPHHTPPPPQQHGYPTSHSSYPYSQAHSAAPTPPQQQQQQQLVPPPVPASPGPGQMHQAPQQQSQSHALGSLSRFVSQQSTSPSPRASPSLAHQQQHHQQQLSQMGPHSPAPFGGHLDHHSVTMNGHSSMGPNTTPPVMSPPPPMAHVQQAMSPPPIMPIQQHHLPPQSPSPYNVNGSGSVMDRHSPTKLPSASPDMMEHETDFRKLDAQNTIPTKEQDMHNIFSELPSGLCTKDIDNVDSGCPTVVNNEPPPVSAANANFSNPANDLASIMNSNSSESSFPSSSPLRRESIDSCNITPQPDIPRPNGSGGAETTSRDGYDPEQTRSSVSPQAKSMGSPTSAGNGHQMMPVRLQNMQKGARTKASMKKLMQEQHIATPNGQASDVSSDGGGGIGKEAEMESIEVIPKGKGRTPKAPRKKKSQTQPASPDTNSLTVNQSSAINPDLSSNDTIEEVVPSNVRRPGYTKSGKKIGRPRKDAPPEEVAPPTTKGKGKKATPVKKGKKSVDIVSYFPMEEVDSSISALPVSVADSSEVIAEFEGSEEIQSRKKTSPKRKGAKGSRKRPSKVVTDASDLEKATDDLSPLDSSDLLPDPTPALDEIPVAQVVTKGKKRASAKTSPNASFSPPDTVTTEPIETSEITEQTAKSVAENYIAPVTTSPSRKSRKKGKKSEQAEDIPEVDSLPTPIPKNNKKASPKKVSVSPVKDADASEEREGLPRLRSRSPKQNESPPLRVSSPRAAKEKSTTPASISSNQRSPRASRSREKDVAAPVTTPLTSPKGRSPRKVTEKVEKVRGSSTRPGRSKQNLNDLLELENEYLSPPPVKRTRQISKESTESAEHIRGTRKGIGEPRASVDSDRSLSSVGKRTSRRKSGSVSGSTDRDSLASPTFNQSSSSIVTLPPSDISFETPTEPSSTSVGLANNTKRGKKKKTPMYPVKRGKGKFSKQKSKSKKAPVKAAVEIVEPLMPPEENGIPVEGESSIAVSEEPLLPAPIPKGKGKKKKPYVKKGRKANGLAPIQSVPDSAALEENLEESIFAPVAEVIAEDQVIENKLPTQQKGKKKGSKKSKQNVTLEQEATSVLNIPAAAPPTPAPNTQKKKGKAKLENKQPKQPKKSSKKKVEAPQEKDPYHFDSSDLTATGSSASIATDDDSKVATGFVFSPPQDLVLGRRRRSSAMSPVNTQNSAKASTNGTGTESPVKLKSEEVGGGAVATPTTVTKAAAKPHRRDSRSLSKEYSEVSIVLSDIVRSPEFSNLSRHSPSLSDIHQMSPPLSLSSPIVHPPPGKFESPEPIATESLNTVSSAPAKIRKQTKAAKKRSSTELEVEKPPKKKSKLATSQTSEFQERKANLEAEVARALLDLKSGSSGPSSKGSSPAKSIPGTDFSETPDSVQSPKKRSKAGKTGRRRKSTSSRLSHDTSGIKQETVGPPTLSGEIVTPELGVISSKKRKSVKKGGRRPSLKTKSKKAPTFASLVEPASSANTSLATDAVVQSVSFLPQATHGTPVKVVKTAVIPTASSLGIPEPVPSPVIAPVSSKVKGKVKLEKDKSPKRKKSQASPDITAAPSVSTISPEITATSTPKPRRKRPLKAEIKMEASSNANQSVTVKVEDTLGEASTSGQPPPKKKRQRKPKVPATPNSDPVPSTSAAAAAADQLPYTSRLFPYQTEPKPFKKPTVFTKSLPVIQSGKADDNQKNLKGKDGPSVRVLGGVAKFYRGGEEEDVDPDPRLPKEKGQLPTDNAVPWICSFCQLGPHAQKLGDLFGPYFADLPAKYGSSPKRETWFHGDCALWAGRLSLIGTSVRRLEETLLNADKETCTVCKRSGATIGCLQRGCKQAAHYPCAIRRFWKMDGEQYHSYCPEHSSLKFFRTI